MKRIPEHLRKYVVEQDYSRYTAEDQAVWRYIMRQLKDFLSVNAHECYVDGLAKTGIEVDRIPRIETMNEKLQDFGWGAVPVSGFIPPAAFMEFQSLGFLPIASDMRTIDHILYTPAPDIVHEAAGHAPILIDPKFASYLFRYAQVASHAILSDEDLKLYEAIRELSDVKENPNSTPEEIRAAEQQLEAQSRTMTFVSEAGLLSRMNWWTAEYGLIGSLDRPRLFGAGLLSSVGEARGSLKASVRKIPLSLDCIEYSYDITEPQPQLFVTPDFETLTRVLDELAERMAFRQGGLPGLFKARQARTVTTAELDSGLQISGILEEYLTDESGSGERPVYLRFRGPSQLAVERVEIAGHGRAHHPQGYGTPVGRLKSWDKCLSELSPQDLAARGISDGRDLKFEFASGVRVEGHIDRLTFANGRLVIVTLSRCRVTLGDRLLFDPSWGVFDMGVGQAVVSVFGGPADRRAYGASDDFVAARVPRKTHSAAQMEVHVFYAEIRALREQAPKSGDRHGALTERFLTDFPELWLAGVELLEIGLWTGVDARRTTALREHLGNLGRRHPQWADRIADGIRLADRRI